MITKVFAVYDTKAQMYQAPFFMPATGAAVRVFADAVNDPQVSLSRHPSDYILFQIGTFNDVEGTLESIVPPVNLGLGSDYVERKNPVVVGRSMEEVKDVLEVANGSEKK